jgi:hypothetical protein
MYQDPSFLPSHTLNTISSFLSYRAGENGPSKPTAKKKSRRKSPEAAFVT